MISLHGGYYLDEVKREDAQAMEGILQDDQVHRNTLRIPFPYTRKDADQHIGICLERYRKWEEEDRPSKLQQIIRNESGEMVGDISLEQSDTAKHILRLGYYLRKDLRGQGIMSAALSKMITSAFLWPEVVRIEAAHFTFNPASGKVMEKNGFTREGILRSYYDKPGVGCLDGVMWSLLRSDIQA